MLATVWVQAKATWLKLPPSVRWGTSLFLLARGVLWLWGWAVAALVPYAPPTVLPDGPLPSAIEPMLLPWMRHDVLWFVRIAIEGYTVPDGRGSKSPLYPLLIQWGGAGLGGEYSVATVIIADIGCVVSLILLYELAQREFQVGRRTLLALMLYPYAFYLWVPYSESLLMALTLGAFLSARAGRWWLVGVCGGLAVLTKVTALAMLPALALELWQTRRRAPLRQGAWLLLLLLAAGGWIVARQLTLNATELTLGSAVLSPDFQAGWNANIGWPWQGVTSAVSAPFRLWPGSYTTMAVINLLLVGVLAYLTWLALKLPNRPWAVYAITMFVINLMLLAPLVPLLDMPRRMLAAFPLFIAAALYWPRRGRRSIVIGALVAELALSALFVKWVFIG